MFGEYAFAEGLFADANTTYAAAAGAQSELINPVIGRPNLGTEGPFIGMGM